MSTAPARFNLAIVMALAIGAFVLLACGGSGSKPSLVSTAAPAGGQTAGPTPAAGSAATAVPATQIPATPAPATQKFKIGDVIHINDLNLAVLGWEELKPTEFAKPEAGQKFIAVELVFVNTGKDSTNISSLAQMKLKDDTAQQYDTDFLALTAAGSKAPDGKLVTGEKLRGKVAFAIPVAAKGLQFVFDASLFSSGKVFVNLGDTPELVEAPAELAGEVPQQLYTIGDAIKMGDLVLTINTVKTPKPSEFAKPEKGQRFLVVDMTIENTSSAATNLSSLLNMELKDTSGQAYSLDLMAMIASGGKTPDGELAPGEKIKGQIGYQVPEDAKNLLFVFDGDLFGDSKIFVKLP